MFVFHQKKYWQDLFCLTLLFSFMYTLLLGDRPFGTPDEARYVEIAREMVETQDYLTPRLNGIKYFEKPALYYWMLAGGLKIFGTSEWGLRLWPALLTLCLCLATYVTSFRLFDRKTAVLSALVLGTALQVFSHARILILDIPVSVFLGLGLFFFLRATQTHDLSFRRRLILGYFVFLALATLTKGLMSLVIPGGVIFFWILWSRRYDCFRLAFHPVGLGIYALMTAPWHIWVSIVNPEFPYFYFIHEHFLRYLTDVHGRYQPPYMFFGVFLLGMFPWTAYFFAALPEVFKEKHDIKRETLQFCFIWVVFTLVFFSTSNSKLIPYILPVYPAAAMITGYYLRQVFSTANQRKGYAHYGTLVLYGLIGVVGFIAPCFDRGVDVQSVFPYAVALLCISIFVCVVFYFQKTSPSFLGRFVTLILSSMGVYVTLLLFWPHVDRPSLKPIVENLQPHLKPGDKIMTYHRYFYDLPVYLNQKVPFIHWGGEFEYGLQHEPDTPWRLNNEQLKKIWDQDETVYLIMRDDIYRHFKKERRFAHQLFARYKNIRVIKKVGK